MELPAPPEDDHGRAPVAPPEWRSLGVLRDRVEAAAREIERLRSENAALGQRLVDLQDHPAPSFALADGDDPAALRARVQGFIDVVDGLLAQPVADSEPVGPEPAGSDAGPTP